MLQKMSNAIRQGKGTFVRRTMFVDPLKDLTGISNMLSQMQVDRESVVPVLEHIETPAWIAQSIRQQLFHEGKSGFLERNAHDFARCIAGMLKGPFPPYCFSCRKAKTHCPE